MPTRLFALLALLCVAWPAHAARTLVVNANTSDPATRAA